MKIELDQQYKSIVDLATEDLPDFAVLIGRNGAGKTQLLDALKQGRAKIPGIGVNEVELYDMASFVPPNTGQAGRHANQFAQDTADAFLSPPRGQPPIETAKAIFDQFVLDIERNSGVQARYDFVRGLRDEVQRMPDFTVFRVNHPDSSYEKILYERVLGPLDPGSTGRSSRRSSNRTNSFNGNQAALLSATMKLTGKLLHELTRNDIMRASYFEGETLSNSISAVFAAYKIDQFIWTHQRIETEDVSFAELITEYRTNNQPPWEKLREILSEMREAAGDDGLFDFDFSDPDDDKLHMGNYERFSFTAAMTNRTTGAQYNLDSLSSGEKVLMALCLVSFNQYLGRRRPKLLLLDELDALLHPSMVAALITTLKTLFVTQGTKVLMTSHSPMTVAALDEADIFRVVRTGDHVDISRITKSEAIDDLSEGLATVDRGLRIAAYDEAKVTILTEGNNTKHLKRWVELYFPEDVYVFEELEHHRSDSQLLTYGRLLARMNTNTHFVVVWDCDAAGKAEKLRQDLSNSAKVTPFAFARRQDNAVVRNGIENNYAEDILEPFTIKKVDNNDKLLRREFPPSNKTKFAAHVREKGTSQYFTNYEDLRDIVNGLLGLQVKS